VLEAGFRIFSIMRAATLSGKAIGKSATRRRRNEVSRLDNNVPR
jgi:hypothetical protein